MGVTVVLVKFTNVLPLGLFTSVRSKRRWSVVGHGGFRFLISIHIYFFHLDDKTPLQTRPTQHNDQGDQVDCDGGDTVAHPAPWRRRDVECASSPPTRRTYAPPLIKDIAIPLGPRVCLRLTWELPMAPTDFKIASRGSYVTEVAVGTPAQYVSLGLDLNSADVVMLNHKFAKGMPFEVEGFVSNDQLIVGGGSGDQLKRSNFPFVELVSPDSLFEHFEDGVSGWVGFGPRCSDSTDSPSIVHSMISQGLLDRPMVGLSFTKNNAHVAFGGINARYKDDDITFFPLPPSGGLGWEVPVSGVRVGGKPVAEGRARGMLLPGFEAINGPTDQVEAIADAVGAENYALPCAGPGPDVTAHSPSR